MRLKNAGRIALVSVFCLLSGIFVQFSYVSEDTEQIYVSDPKLPPYLMDTTAWVDSVFQTLSLEDKLAQSIMLPVYPRLGKSEQKRIDQILQRKKIGGLIFFQGTPYEVATWSKHFQEKSSVPLLIAIDGEWGLSMRLDSTIKYPRQMMLGAIKDNNLIYQMGQDIAKQLQHIGIHVNFAPVADVNNNAGNPVINSRSFGELRDNVALKSIAYSDGMQSKRVIAVAKHFPGHGDTEIDSHHDLPVIKHDKFRIDSIELYPFKRLINSGVGGMMMAHMNVTAIDSTPDLPTSLSALAIDSLLIHKMGFKGLVFTDAMTMKGVTGKYGPIEANIRAYKAGNDILLMPGELNKSLKALVKEVKKEKISLSIVDK
ncbi:MAG: beta-N-acetylglucosaminidase, partial [Bacteroidales bacterium]|nr:beta-N-acetylglucosaminidase [Bacteroidales bacterium]